jgi:hypothetical protein
MHTRSSLVWRGLGCQLVCRSYAGTHTQDPYVRALAIQEKRQDAALFATTIAAELEALVITMCVPTPLDWPHINPNNDPTHRERGWVRGARECLEELLGLRNDGVMPALQAHFCANIVTSLARLPTSTEDAVRQVLHTLGCLDVFMLCKVVLDKVAPRHVPYNFLWDSLGLLNSVLEGGHVNGAGALVVNDPRALRLIQQNHGVVGGKRSEVPGVVLREGIKSLCFVDVLAPDKTGSVFIVDLDRRNVIHVGVGFSASMQTVCLSAEDTNSGIRTRDAIARYINLERGSHVPFKYEFYHIGGGFKMKTRDYGQWATYATQDEVSKVWPTSLSPGKVYTSKEFKLYPLLVAVVEAHVASGPLAIVAQVDLRAYEWHMVQRLVVAGNQSPANVARLCAMWSPGQFAG